MVVVTYKRQELLTDLFDSILQLTQAPWRIVVVDNENSADTRTMVEQFSERVTGRWGKTIIDGSGNQERVVYLPQDHNGGGAGGFSAGVRKAYELGAKWFWVMDDDVAVEPEGLDLLAKWSDRYQVVQGSRLDYDGGPFYWQYHFLTALGIPDSQHRQLEHRRGAPAQFHIGYEPLSHYAQPGLYGQVFHGSWGLSTPGFRPRDPGNSSQGSHSPSGC